MPELQNRYIRFADALCRMREQNMNVKKQKAQ